MSRSKCPPDGLDPQDLAQVTGGLPRSQGGTMAIDAIAKLREQGVSPRDIDKKIRLQNILNGAPTPK